MSEEAYEAHQKRVKGMAVSTARQVFTQAKPPKVPPKPKKYRNNHVIIDGQRFDSEHEARVWQDLQTAVKSGAIRNLNRQVSFPLTVQGTRIQRWRCDYWFEEKTADGQWRIVIADAKSAYTRNLQSWKRTKLLFESLYGMQVREL